MEFIEREWSTSEEADYVENIRQLMIAMEAAEATPIHITLKGEKFLVGWLLRKKVAL